MKIFTSEILFEQALRVAEDAQAALHISNAKCNTARVPRTLRVLATNVKDSVCSLMCRASWEMRVGLPNIWQTKQAGFGLSVAFQKLRIHLSRKGKREHDSDPRL